MDSRLVLAQHTGSHSAKAALLRASDSQRRMVGVSAQRAFTAAAHRAPIRIHAEPACRTACTAVHGLLSHRRVSWPLHERHALLARLCRVACFCGQHTVAGVAPPAARPLSQLEMPARRACAYPPPPPPPLRVVVAP